MLKAWQRLTDGSINRKIFGAAVTVALLTVIVKLVAVTKELAIAWRFGTGDTIDAFLIAFLIPSFIINVVAGSFNAALIPTYIQVREQEGKKAAQKLFCNTTFLNLALLGTTTILTLVSAPAYLPLIASGFSPQKLDFTFNLLVAIAPVVLLSGMITMWGAVLNAGERFALAALSPLMTPTITVVLLLVAQSWGIYAVVAGLVFGAALEMLLLGAALYRQGISLRPKWYGFDAHLRQVADQYAPAIAGAFLMCSTSLVDQSMAAMLSPGSVAALNYGNKFIVLPTGITATALGTAVIPYFSQMVAYSNWTSLNSTIKHYLRLIFFITVPLTILIIISSELIVQILFQRGSFTASDTELVSQIQSLYAIQIPFYVGSSLLVNLIRAMRKNHVLMWVSAFNLGFNILFNYVFMQWIGIKGIALSTSGVYLFSFFYLLFFAYKDLKIFLQESKLRNL